MRFHELLESVGKYRPMFNMFAHDGHMPEWIDKAIRDIEGVFKREDRVVWALRWFRLWQAVKFNPGLPNDAEAWRKVTKGLPQMDAESLRFHAQAFIDANESFRHFLSLPIAKIERYTFGQQTPAKILASFEESEEEWQANRRQIVNHQTAYGSEEDEDYDDEDEDEDDDYEDEESNYNYFDYNSWTGKQQRKNPVHGHPFIMLDFHNGWAWWDLNRAFCEVEGGAMGHCGNTASPGEDDHVLSLRKHMGGDEYRPSCTFILNKNGMLGEMKGRANEKPKPEYYDMIAALLMDPRVKGIVGGGYDAAKNFSVLDLPKETQEFLLEQKPTLLSPGEAYKVFDESVKTHGPTPEALSKLENGLESFLSTYNLSFDSMRMVDGEPYAIIKEYRNLDYVNRVGVLDMLEDFFDLEELSLAFQRFDYTLGDEEAENMVREAKAINFAPAAKVCLEDLCDEFELDGVGYKVLDDGKVLLCISAYNLAHPTGQNDPDDWDDDIERPRFVFDRINSLAADLENEVHTRDDDLLNDVDLGVAEDPEAVLAVLKYIINFSQSAMLAAQEAVFDSVRDPERTVFSRDPRQLNLFGDDSK